MNFQRIIAFMSMAVCTACSSSVEVQNGSDLLVQNMVVAVGGNDLHVETLRPGETTVISYKPKADSSISVTFETSPRSLTASCEADVYVTSPSRDHFLVTVAQDGSCRVIRKRQ